MQHLRYLGLSHNSQHLSLHKEEAESLQLFDLLSSKVFTVEFCIQLGVYNTPTTTHHFVDDELNNNTYGRKDTFPSHYHLHFDK